MLFQPICKDEAQQSLRNSRSLILKSGTQILA